MGFALIWDFPSPGISLYQGFRGISLYCLLSRNRFASLSLNCLRRSGYIHIYIYIYIYIYAGAGSARLFFVARPSCYPLISGKDKGGPSKGGFLNNRLFSWIMYDSYTPTINFITQIYRSVYGSNRLFRKPPLLGPPLSCYPLIVWRSATPCDAATTRPNV